MSKSPIDADGNGGMAARRAIVRWTWRLMRRQRRQCAVIVVLVTLVVAATVFAAAAAYNLAPAAGAAEFGEAGTVIFFERDQESMTSEEWLAIGADVFGTTEPIGHRPVALPGSAMNVDYRSQALDGPFSGPMLDLMSGRGPRDAREVAVTDGIAELLRVGVGDTVDLDGTPREVVGIVENPSDFDDEFVLLESSQLDDADTIAMLVSTNEDGLRQFGNEVGGMRVSGRSDIPQNVLAGVLTLLASTVVLALVALVAAATFAVLAQRRLAQLGMLSAIGATERHLRLSMLAIGALTGVVGSIVGAVAGGLAWIALTPTIESVVAHRIDTAAIPWWIVLTGALLAVTATTIAAWWPARSMSRIPTVVALSGRMPRPPGGTRSALLAPCVAGAGVLALYRGSGFGRDAPDMIETLLLIGGTLSLLAGVLLMSPILVRAVGRLAGRAPIAPRLALRDLSRYQARSSAALAAIGLALGVPAVIVAATAAEQNATPMGNLANNQLLIRPEDFDGPFVPDTDRVDEIAVGVAELAATLGAERVVPLQMVFDPAMPREPKNAQRIGVSVDLRISDGWMFVGNVHAATPELLDVMHLDPSSVADGEIVTVADGDLSRGPRLLAEGPPPTDLGDAETGPLKDREPITDPGTLPLTYSSLPQALIDPDAALANGWTVEEAGRWLVEFAVPLDADRLAGAREIAGRYNMVVESRDDDATLARVRLVAGAIGMLLALAVLAATVGLIRSESSGELRTLTAAGATGWTRRGVTAACAGSLALLGALLGVTSAYLGLAAGRVDHLTPLPWRDLAMILIATPALATLGGWLHAGRQPEAIARRPLD
jgi:putative ABC transport system permease protein